LRLYSTLSSPQFVQEAALEALRSPQKEVEKMRKEYERRGKMMYKRLEEMKVFKCNKPEGAFYLFPDVKSLGKNSVKISHELLRKARVLVIPGTEFGNFGEGFVRMSYATSYEKIQEAMDRIETWSRHAK
jgi:aspartate/methionine/tyrosine aminotransferase